MSSNTQEYTERLQHWARISFSPQQHNSVAQSRLVKHLAPAFFFAFASRCLFAALQLASALRCLFSMVPTARNTSASAPQPATSSRWLFAAAPLPASASRCLFSMVPTATRCPLLVCSGALGEQHLPDGSSLQHPCQQQTSFGGEEYSGLASNLAHLGRIC